MPRIIYYSELNLDIKIVSFLINIFISGKKLI